MAEPTPTPDVRLLRSITLRNILSFGPDTPPLELRALNVLIGPNGSGKSNLLDVVQILREAADSENLRADLKADHWMWKGQSPSTVAIIEAHGISLARPDITDEYANYKLIIYESGGYGWKLDDWKLAEKLETYFDFEGESLASVHFDSTTNKMVVMMGGKMTPIADSEIDRRASAMAQLRGLTQYPIVSLLTRRYRQIRLYREWTFGRNSGPRLPRPTDERNDFLAEDGSNLGLVLNKLRTYPEVKDQFISALNNLYEGIRDYEVLVEGNTAQIFLREGNTMIPATRLSDGTLRYLCLLAILLHPTPPPLICLEEPELGLHPDAIVAVGQLLKEASTRTQLIVTTHSQILLDTFQESPEDVVVVSKEDGSTQCKRLDAEKLRPYLEKYSLGSMWNSGDIGGNRW
jgi:predicted ATPase